MKLRIKGNSIRFRLAQAEVAELAERGELWAMTEFGAARLRYGVRADAQDSRAHAEFGDGALVLSIPATRIRRWAASDDVSIHAEQPLAEGTLKLLLEKDFHCLQPREDEDESDLFPHPAAEQP